MFKLLVDTCVWLDLAKDPHQQSLIDVLEELIDSGEVSLIIPRTILDEFKRNNTRILQESKRGFTSHFKQVKEAVKRFGNSQEKLSLLTQLNDLDHKIPLMGESTTGAALKRITKLFRKSAIVEITDDIMIRAAQRAIEGKAPFHRKKNSMGDAIIIETYANCIQDKDSTVVQFAFVTHNTDDFSMVNGSHKIPHPDFGSLFNKRRSMYSISLLEVLRKIDPPAVMDIELNEMLDEPRALSEIRAAEKELNDIVWFNRHMILQDKVEKGQHRIVDDYAYYKEFDPDTTPRTTYERARKVAKRMGKRYGADNIRALDDIEWGMLNGKLSALRWVLGDDWDNLDT
jgi:predicted SnoaL-like aldol condensation-catalyzing enzyme